MSGTFLNTLMLAGLGGAALPLVLHLLSRARYRSVDWGAMMFLDGVDAPDEAGSRLRQWTLLAVRMAIVALLAIALARPVVAGRWGGHAGASSVDAVILLDRSASMAWPEAGRTRFDLAREAALQILSSLHKGDRVALVLAGDGSTRGGAAPALTADLQEVASRVADLRVSSGAADFAQELPAALAAFDSRSQGARELYIVTDAQAASWDQVKMPFPIQWRHRLAQLGGEAPQLHVIPVGGPAAANVSIDSLQLVNAPAVAGTPTAVEMTLRNHGPARRELPLIVRSPQGLLFSRNVAVDAGADATLAFTAVLKTPGPQTLTAEIRSDVLSDDRRQLAVDVVAPIRVLIISGDEPPEQERAESYYLRAALAPFSASGRAGADLAAVQVIEWQQWQPAVSGHDVLVLANVPELTAAQARAVEQFIYAGGGLLIAPGNLTRPDRYNAQLRRGSTSLLPASLEPARSTLQPVQLQALPADPGHPVFHHLQRSTPIAQLGSMSRYFPAHADQGASVIARYANGDAMLIESAYGGGRVMLLTTSVDGDWGDLPMSPQYLPLMQSVVKRLAGAGLDDRNLNAGEDLRAAFDGAVEGAKATLILPTGARRTIDAVQFAGRSEVRFDATALPGLYTLNAAVDGKQRALQYVVRPSRRESDPAQLSPAQWAELEAIFDLTRIDAQADALAAALVEVRTGRELWGGILAGVIALGLLEMVLARRWSEGGI